MGENLEILAERLPQFADGIWVTAQLTVLGGVLAFVIAVILGLGARTENILVRGAARTVIEFFRGTSLVVQLFWLFYVLPLLGYRLDALLCGVLALGLNYGAYASEVVRRAINSVPQGQWEAARALSLSPVRRMRKIIWPQAWSIMIPSMANLFIMLLKGTAVAYIILMHDLTWESNQLRQATGDTFFSFGFGMIVYFLIALVIVLIANLLERIAKRRLGQLPAVTKRTRASVDLAGSHTAGTGGRG